MNEPTTQPVAEGATAELVELVNQLFDAAESVDYVEALTRATYFWLTTPDLDLSQIDNRNQLSLLFGLIRFVSKLDAITGQLPGPLETDQEGGQAGE